MHPASPLSTMPPAVLTLLALLALAAAQSVPCTWSAGNATFDLGPMYKKTGYTLQDIRNSDTRKFVYYFNFCAKADLALNIVQNACNVTHGDNNQGELTGDSPAYQYDQNADLCVRLSDSVDDIAWSLYDNSDPSRGVALTYQGGNKCLFAGDRSLKIWVQCTGNPNEEAQSVERVSETDTCKYEVFIKSQHACPLECPVVAGQLCAEHGVCGFDNTLGASRCFCDEGFDGADCTHDTSKSGGLSATAAVLIVVCIVMVALLAGLVHFWRKVRTLRLDPQAYSMLRGDEDGAGAA